MFTGAVAGYVKIVIYKILDNCVKVKGICIVEVYPICFIWMILVLYHFPVNAFRFDNSDFSQ